MGRSVGVPDSYTFFLTLPFKFGIIICAVSHNINTSSDDESATDEVRSNSDGSDGRDSTYDIINDVVPIHLTGTFRIGDSVNHRNDADNEAEEGVGEDKDVEAAEMNELQHAIEEVVIRRMD